MSFIFHVERDFIFHSENPGPSDVAWYAQTLDLMHVHRRLPSLSEIPGLAQNPSLVSRRCYELVVMSVRAWEVNNLDTNFAE